MKRFIGGLLLLGSTVAWGQLLDPAVLHIGPGASSPCAKGGAATGPCQYLFNNHTEVNGVDTEADIYFNGGGGPLVTPVLAILGVPEDTTGTALDSGSVNTAQYFDNYVNTSSVATNSLTTAFGTSKFGFDGNGFQGFFSDSSLSKTRKNKKGKFLPANDVYDFLGLVGNASNNFGNWHDADVAVNGFDTNALTQFGIYVYAFDLATFDGGDLIDFLINVPKGTFIVAYGQDCNPCSKLTGGEAFTTPFTEAGLKNTDDGGKVPEPGSLLLVGSAVLFVCAKLRKKLMRA